MRGNRGFGWQRLKGVMKREMGKARGVRERVMTERWEGEGSG